LSRSYLASKFSKSIKKKKMSRLGEYLKNQKKKSKKFFLKVPLEIIKKTNSKYKIKILKSEVLLRGPKVKKKKISACTR